MQSSIRSAVTFKPAIYIRSKEGVNMMDFIVEENPSALFGGIEKLPKDTIVKLVEHRTRTSEAMQEQVDVIITGKKEWDYHTQILKDELIRREESNQEKKEVVIDGEKD